MTGKELIEWIKDNHAEDKEVIIEHRDSGGSYHTAEHLGEFNTPQLVVYRDDAYGVIDSIFYNCENPIAILL